MSEQSHNITQAAHHLRMAADALARACPDMNDRDASVFTASARVFTDLARKQLADSGRIMPIAEAVQRTPSEIMF